MGAAFLLLQVVKERDKKMNYNPKSLKAEEFISDEEIRETIRYAEENKNNVALIDEILEKARPQKTENGNFCVRFREKC